jgi:hypothetical protein
MKKNYLINIRNFSDAHHEMMHCVTKITFFGCRSRSINADIIMNWDASELGCNIEKKFHDLH